MFLTLKVQGLVFQEAHLDRFRIVLINTLKLFSLAPGYIYLVYHMYFYIFIICIYLVKIYIHTYI